MPKGYANVPSPFPEDRRMCVQCPCITRRCGIRWECLLTGEYLIYPEDGRGWYCFGCLALEKLHSGSASDERPQYTPIRD